MPPAKKRKTRSTTALERAEAQRDETQQQQPTAVEAAAPPATESPPTEKAPAAESPPTEKVPAAAEAEDTSMAPPPPTTTAASATVATTTAADRLARLKALKARAKTSSEENFKAATREAQRANEDPSQLVALQRQHAIASHKLLKADVEDAGGDFERKRAWDWTVDESEAWDRRMKKKGSRRDGNVFSDYTVESNKVYKRQVRQMKPDMTRYEKEKASAIQKAAAAGGLDIIETEDGELIAVDKDGSFYSTTDSTTFAENKPDKAAIDRLVDDMRRAEDQRLKKRRERMAKDGNDDGDVTYINEKNKQFNQKLSRFYDKYTSDLRDSFERGTAV